MSTLNADDNVGTDGTDGTRRYRTVSLWLDELAASGADDLTPRQPLTGDLCADVCIVGAGYSGLWTAYYLLQNDPGLNIVLVEAEIAGFGASGRNGGWCSALFPTSAQALARTHGRAAALAMRRAMTATVAEVGRVADAEGIDCHWAPGGTVRLARTRTQLERAQAEVQDDREGDGVDDVQLLSAARARQLVGATRVLGGSYTPHCARIQPARLVRGLAAVVERRGALITEQTRALRIEPGGPGRRPAVITDRGTVTARCVVRATEAWTATLPGTTRAVVPVYSLMVATQPLPSSFWAAAGIRDGLTFADHRHLIVYGQRTADDRLVFGGRGAPYHFGSRIDPDFDREPAVFAGLEKAVVQLFPELHDAAFTHRWGGPLGISRDWRASVGHDRATGLAWAGGYVGDGVGTANLAGRTLADLLLERDSDLTALPWVGHSSRRWEPEPLRWLGVNAGLQAMTAADAEERLTRRSSLVARALAPLLGH